MYYTSSTGCRAFEAIILKMNSFRHWRSPSTQPKLRPLHLNPHTHLVNIPGGIYGGLQVRRGGPHHRGPVPHLRRKVPGVGEHGAVGGDQNLAVLEPHVHLPPLHLLVPDVCQGRLRLERPRLLRRVLHVRVLLHAPKERVREKHTVAGVELRH